jgi:hypothetical protein
VLDEKMMNDMNPPPVLDSARVVAYAIVPDDIEYTARCSLSVNGELLGRVPRLAICENLSEPKNLMLFHCDESWNVLGVSGAGSIEDIKRSAEINYPGIGQHWKDRGVSMEEALAYYDAHSKGLICSFCGKRPYEVESLIQGPGVQICESCVCNFYNVFI